MNLKRLLAGCGTMALVLSVVSPALAQVDLGQFTADGSVEAGAIPQPVPYNDVAKYQEYRDLAQQFIVPKLQLILGDKAENYYVQFDAVDVAQKNQMYSLRFGEYGLLDVQAKFIEIPHYFSDHVASTPYDESGGNFSLSSKPTATGAALQSWLGENSKPFDMSLLEGVADINVRYTPTPSLSFSANMDLQNPTGQQPFGGSFLFGANPGTFKVNELWVPTQYYTYNFGTGMEYSKNGWLIGFQYQGSFFVDDYSTLTWDNPATAGVGSACTDSATFTSTGMTGPCQGRAAMYPNNQAHNFIVNGAGQLPFNTHVMGSLEYGFWLQNAPFIPLTSNSTMRQSLGSVGAPNSLGGDVRPFFANFTIDSNPIEPLDLKATYSYFDYDNQTPAITFTGVKSLNDVSDPQTPFTAYPFSFSEQDLSFEPTYRITDTLAAHFNIKWQTNHNAGLEVLQQDQTSYGPSLDWNPYPWLTFRADYQHAHRDSPGYNNNRTSLVQVLGGDPGAIEELQDLRRFDEATLDVNQTSLYASVQPIETLTLFTAFSYDDDNYPSTDFGLQHTSSYSPSVGASWDPLAGVHLFSDYAWQAYDWNTRSLDESTIPAPKPPAGKTPAWTAIGRNQGSNIDFGMDIAIPPNRILPRPSHLKLQYTYTVGSNSTHQAGDTAAATSAIDYPSVGSQFQELIVQYEYELRDNVAINIGYYFTHYGENNFMVDQMGNYMPHASANSTFLGNTVMSPYNANVGFITLKYKF
ncbi:MtrB/PioB family outer membrane beta-barrel protein [Candidatus Binatus sp.]|uniref:MtrB/PioB family outer membrane beta-barrel protein n=1 Tax=Candidatus Binatus sp. TaxID=2811406 RepID=UPI002F95E3E6